jgi:D-alanyl-lipoteichoic acid acyltransferase DltB (MBOAT superfamily)
MRAKDFLPQIMAPRLVNGAKFYNGAYLVFLGLFQKMFIADNMAKIVNPIFNHGTCSNGADFLIAMYAFTFQIFGDFAGYSNMARGLGLMMGFEITVNFNTPFFATNVQDFWNRWHISLSHWIRDYLYLPLMGAFRRIKGTGRIYLALMVSMTLIGLWHGAAWNFIFFGIYYGVLLSLYVMIRIRWANLILPKSPWGIRFWFWLRVLFIFHLTVFGMMIFRCHSLSQVGGISKALVLNFHPSVMNSENFIALIGFSMPLIVLQLGEYWTDDIFFILKRHWALRSCLLAIMTYLLLGWGVMKAEEFIYFQF